MGHEFLMLLLLVVVWKLHNKGGSARAGLEEDGAERGGAGCEEVAGRPEPFRLLHIAGVG